MTNHCLFSNGLDAGLSEVVDAIIIDQVWKKHCDIIKNADQVLNTDFTDFRDYCYW